MRHRVPGAIERARRGAWLAVAVLLLSYGCGSKNGGGPGSGGGSGADAGADAGSGADGGSGNDGGGPAASFELRVGPSITAQQGSNGLLRVHVVRQSGFSDPIEVSLAQPPAGVSGGIALVEAEDEARLPLRIAAEVPVGGLDLVVSGTSGAATGSASLHVEVQPAQPRSGALIQAALDAGKIDLGTSLLYRAQAVFGDARLPAAFVGSGPAEEDVSLFVEIEQARPNLPAPILDQLQPYLVRPDDPKSVFNASRPSGPRRGAAPQAADQCSGSAREWITARSAVHPVRAWALCLGTAASATTSHSNLVKILDVVDKAYGQMTALMGPARPDLYADEAIDVYAVPPDADVPRESGDYAVEGVRGVSPPQPPYVGRRSSGYVMMPTYRLAQRDYELTVIHELFHVLQFAHTFTLTQYWFSEASASWASVHFNRTAPVRPADNGGLHRERFGGFQASSEGLLSTAGDHEYFAYIWPLFMEQEKGGPSPVGDAWVEFEDATSPSAATQALDGVLPFQPNFHLFAIRNVNELLSPGDPVSKRYRALPDDTFPDTRPTWVPGALAGDVPIERPLDFAALAARYLQFTVGESSGVQSVEFDLSGLSGRAHMNLDALIHTSNGWVAKPVSLDSEPKPRFCFDRGPSTETVRGSFDDLRLVLSNHAQVESEVVSGTLRARPSRSGCSGWSGTVQWSLSSDIAGVLKTDASTLATVTFAVDTDATPVPGIVHYKVVSGHVSYRAEVTTTGCHKLDTGDVEMSATATSGEGATLSSLATFAAGSVLQYGSNTGATYGTIVETGDCGTSGPHPNTLIGWWNLSGTYTLKDNGTLMQEDVTTPVQGGTLHNQWNLRKTSQ